MLPLFLAAALAQAPAGTSSSVSAPRPALAVVRIVRGTEIRFGKAASFEASVTRETHVREPDGALRQASLVEFY